MKINRQPNWLNQIERVIFASRWIQAPLYIGLIAAQCVYVYKFMFELFHLIYDANILTESQVMLMILGLVDIVMVANLLFMVIVGGYETFVSRLYIESHPDKPDWIDHVSAGVQKIKLASALISISSIHLLKSFINIENMKMNDLILQIVIHVAFLLSALCLVVIEKLLHKD